VALAESLVRARAREAGLAYELLATRAELQAIVTASRAGGEADVRTLTGWRREVAGEELLGLLGGRSSLKVSGSGSEARVQIAPSGGAGES
jgi:ribonuclease D